MTLNSPPSRNPADNGTLLGLLRLAFAKFIQNVDDMLPAQVIAYNRTTNMAQVQPLINMVTTDNQIVNRAQIAAVPVFQLGAGGFVISFPVKSGDYGWIKANDRDISIFKQTMAQSSPNTQRKHNFSDAMFFPDTMLNGVTVASSDAANLVIQNYAGTTKISMGENGIGINSSPVAGCALAITSTTEAFSPPVMTTAQRNAIPSPQEGFMIYNITTHAIEVYTNAGWP